MDFRACVLLGTSFPLSKGLNGVVVEKKGNGEALRSPLVVGGAILAVVALALIVTLAWYFLHFGKVP